MVFKGDLNLNVELAAQRPVVKIWLNTNGQVMCMSTILRYFNFNWDNDNVVTGYKVRLRVQNLIVSIHSLPCPLCWVELASYKSALPLWCLAILISFQSYYSEGLLVQLVFKPLLVLQPPLKDWLGWIKVGKTLWLLTEKRLVNSIHNSAGLLNAAAQLTFCLHYSQMQDR